MAEVSVISRAEVPARTAGRNRSEIRVEVENAVKENVESIRHLDYEGAVHLSVKGELFYNTHDAVRSKASRLVNQAINDAGLKSSDYLVRIDIDPVQRDEKWFADQFDAYVLLKDRPAETPQVAAEAE